MLLLQRKCQRNQWPIARILRIEIDERKVLRAVTLHVVDRNIPGFTQVLLHLITKYVMVVRNDDFDSPTEECKRRVL